jgi:hypothetical protein
MKNITLTLTEEEMIIVKNALFGDSDRFYQDLEKASEEERKAMLQKHEREHRLLFKIIDQENLQKN